MNNNKTSLKSGWEAVMGMEIHAQISSASKLFSNASTNFGAPPNSQVNLVDAAFPGMLPVVNRVCIEKAVLTGLALGAKINNYSVFDRKNYFYPDLPQGYQISQFFYPIVGEGVVNVMMSNGKHRKVGIERLHLEQDAGKNIHDIGVEHSFIDLNRAGIALMEIVTKPDLRSSDECRAFLAKLRTILRYIGTCNGNMEQGSLRADVNVSVRRIGEDLGTRCEIKNLNSLRFIVRAVDYEIERQIELLSSGGVITQQTMLFDPSSGTTRAMRNKEEAHDYRYFPDPDLLPIRLSSDYIKNVKAKLPELPDAKHKRLMSKYNISDYEASILIEDMAAAEFFESVAKLSKSKLAINWVLVDFFGALNKEGQSINDSLITPKNLAELLGLIENNTISGRIAKEVFAEMFSSGCSAVSIVKKRGLEQISDLDEIEKIVISVINDNLEKAKMVAKKPKLRGWFVGQVMERSGKKANPKTVNQLLDKKLPRD